MNILVWIIFGALVGWIAEQVTHSSHGLTENVILGVIGAFVGGFLVNMLGGEGITGFNLYSIMVAVIGAAIVIFLGRMIRR